MVAEFNAKPIREQNLSERKQGGYRDWEAQQKAMGIAVRLGEDAAERAGADRASLTDTLAHFLVARYAVATRRVAETGGREGWHLLREMGSAIVELQKGDRSAERLQIDRERLKLETEKSEETDPRKGRSAVETTGAKRGLTPEERARRMREIFGLALEQKETAGFPPKRSRRLNRLRNLLEPGISNDAKAAIQSD